MFDWENVWNTRFMNLAKEIASWSKDPSTKVGAVIVDQDKKILSTGYNGFPRGVFDSETLYMDKEEKYPRIVHAELNAILNSHADLRGKALFIYPLLPCPECTKAIIQSGIHTIFVSEEQAEDSKWLLAFQKYSLPMLMQASVVIRRIKCS
jgi:dCMP deaminase